MSAFPGIFGAAGSSSKNWFELVEEEEELEGTMDSFEAPPKPLDPELDFSRDGINLAMKQV